MAYTPSIAFVCGKDAGDPYSASGIAVSIEPFIAWSVKSITGFQWFNSYYNDLFADDDRTVFAAIGGGIAISIDKAVSFSELLAPYPNVGSGVGGSLDSWAASTNYTPGASGILDSNGNLQQALFVTGPTGLSAPTWATNLGGLTTDGGVTWKLVLLGANSSTYGYRQLGRSTYHGGAFNNITKRCVAVGQFSSYPFNGSDTDVAVAYWADAPYTSWTRVRLAPTGLGMMTGCAWGIPGFVALTTGSIMHSVDGNTWTEILNSAMTGTPPSTVVWNMVIYNGQYYEAFSYATPKSPGWVAQSPDGVNWSAFQVPFGIDFDTQSNPVIWDSDEQKWVVTQNASIWTSADGVVFVQKYNSAIPPSSNDNRFYSVFKAGTAYFFVGTNAGNSGFGPLIMQSPDLLTFSKNIYGGVEPAIAATAFQHGFGLLPDVWALGFGGPLFKSSSGGLGFSMAPDPNYSQFGMIPITLRVFDNFSQSAPVVSPYGVNQIFTRMISNYECPRYFNKDPLLAPGLFISYNGTAGTVTIYHRHMKLSVIGGTGVDLYVDNLSGFTLSQLAALINSKLGYTVIVTGNSSAPALTLMECNEMSITGTGARLPIFTSVFWIFMKALSWGLLDSRRQQIAAFAETYTGTADTLWLNLLGAIYGRIDRTFDDTDYTYSKRIVYEVIRPRLNLLAIENAVKESIDVIVSLCDRQSDLGWLIGQPLCQNILIDGLHDRGQFIVSVVNWLYASLTPWSVPTNPPTMPSPITLQQGLDWRVNDQITLNNDAYGRIDLPSALRLIIDRNRSAGVKPIYNYQPIFRKALFIKPGMALLYPFNPQVY